MEVRQVDFPGLNLMNGVESMMKTVDELLDEVERRMTKREDGLSPKDLFLGMQENQCFGDNPEIIDAVLQSHVHLLRIAVCINERAIDGWIDGLLEIQENN